MLPSTCLRSVLDMVELAWGSVSTRSVERPFCANPAARLTAVVVFPTPPFWLVIATIMNLVVPPGTRGDNHRGAACRVSIDLGHNRTLRLHFVVSHVLRTHLFEDRRHRFFPGGFADHGSFEHRPGDQNVGIGSERDGDGV